jgi:hypothetical protein
MGYAETVWIRLVLALHEKAHDAKDPPQITALSQRKS